jgi:predicted small lipoprotein YifL
MKWFAVLILITALSGCSSGYKGPIQTADGQRMEEPDYNY